MSSRSGWVARIMLGFVPQPDLHSMRRCCANGVRSQPNVNDNLICFRSPYKILSLNSCCSNGFAKMLELSKQSINKLLHLGFSPEEIPELLNDLTHLIEQSNRIRVNYINQELENLGWGIDIIDESLLEEISTSHVSIEVASEQI